MGTPGIGRHTALLAAIGALGAALVLLRVEAWGAGLTADSTAYVSVARNLLDGGGFTLWNGDAFADHAPFFPMALAFIGLFGVDAPEGAGYLNAAAFGLTAFAAGAWVRSRTASPALAAWAAAACALSPALAGFASHALADALFALFVCLSLFALDRHLGGGGRAWLIAAGACAGLACLTRYVGPALIAAALPPLLLRAARGPRRALPARAAGAAAFLILAALPLGAWMLRNTVHTGAPVGRAWPTGFSPAGSLHTAAGELLDWTLGPLGRAALDSALGAAGVDAGEPSAVSAAALAAALIALASGAGAALARRRRGGGPALPPGAAAPLGFAAVYALALAAALPRTDIELPPRYLAPLYAPLLVAAALILHAVLRRLAGRPPAVRLPLPGGRGAAAGREALILSACLALWLAQWAAPAVAGVREWREHGAGYASPAWAGSDTVRELRERRPAGQIWSNEVRALYLLADVREGNRVLPPSLPDDAGRWVSWAHVYHGGQDGWIVWFHSRHWLEHDYGAAELAALEGLQEAVVLEDGVVFRGDWDGGGEGSRLGGDALLRAAVRGARLAARSDWDVYLDGERAVYVREDCAEADTRPRFFLRVTPADPSDLPGGRREAGFASLNFGFAEHGFAQGGRCVAVRNLPPWPAAAVSTGQWLPGEGTLWQADAGPPPR